MKVRFSLFLLGAASLGLGACDAQPEGEPVVSTALDGTPVERVKPEQAGEAVSETGSSSGSASGSASGYGDTTTSGSASGSSSASTASNGKKPGKGSDPVASACKKSTFENVTFTHCVADPEKHRITTVLRPSGGGQPYGSLSAFAATANKTKIAFAMNAGAFGDDLRAIGYYVEKGERLKLLNRENGNANFFMKPNGVFYGTGAQWRMRTADSFLRNVSDRPNFGTQSGPMMVIDGKLHPDIQKDGPSRAVRNGVGLGADGKAHFVISEDPVSFGKIARFFKDRLGTPNALLLDSNVSALWDPAKGRLDKKRAGPIIVVMKK